jgi:hypothetical protein
VQQTAQSYLFICIFNNFFKFFEDFVDTLYISPSSVSGTAQQRVDLSPLEFYL